MDQQGSKEILKEKQTLYIKFLQSKTFQDEFKYKTYKILFKKIRKKVKIRKKRKYNTDSKLTWQVMKEVTAKQKTKLNLLPKEINFDKTII